MISIVLGILVAILVVSLITGRTLNSILRMFGRMGIRLCIAAFALYALNMLVAWTDFSFAINFYTVGTIAILGVPGLVAIALLTYKVM